jgi:hypothetical protein
MPRSRLLLWLLAVASSGCGGSMGSNPDESLEVFFVGNSLTYVENVQEIVRKLADAGGQKMSYHAYLQPGYALEDHWFDGLPAEIKRWKPDVIVMQQGPSSLPDSRIQLIDWTEKIDSVARLSGGRSALYMVWPPLSSFSAFPAVRDNYAAAATAVDGMFMPAGVTWLEAWDRDPSLELYSKDGFHQSYLGALAAAETIYITLFDVAASEIPALDDGVPPATRAILKSAVATSVAEWGRR